MTEKVFNVPGMSCGHCRMSITNAVKELGDGVRDVRVDLDRKQVTVRFDSADVDEQSIRLAIQGAGYDLA